MGLASERKSGDNVVAKCDKVAFCIDSVLQILPFSVRVSTSLPTNQGAYAVHDVLYKARSLNRYKVLL